MRATVQSRAVFFPQYEGINNCSTRAAEKSNPLAEGASPSDPEAHRHRNAMPWQHVM